MLITEFKADTSLMNKHGKTPLHYANQFVKDADVKTTLDGLLNKIHTSTKVIRNSEAKLQKQEWEDKRFTAVEDLRLKLKQCLIE